MDLGYSLYKSIPYWSHQTALDLMVSGWLMVEFFSKNGLIAYEVQRLPRETASGLRARISSRLCQMAVLDETLHLKVTVTQQLSSSLYVAPLPATGRIQYAAGWRMSVARNTYASSESSPFLPRACQPDNATVPSETWANAACRIE